MRLQNRLAQLAIGSLLALAPIKAAQAYDLGLINHFLACPNYLDSAPDQTRLYYFYMGCRTYAYYGRIRPDHLDREYIRTLEQDQDWLGLANYVLDYGYPLNISDYYLGVAAEGMGQLLAAEFFYRHAQYAALANRDWDCQRIGFDVCHGLHFPEDAWKARQRLQKKLSTH